MGFMEIKIKGRDNFMGALIVFIVRISIGPGGPTNKSIKSRQGSSGKDEQEQNS